MTDAQRHMLIVEDNPGDVRLVREALRDAHASQPGADFRVSNASRIEEGLALIARGDVELILLDLDLPDSEGLESFVRVRDAAPGIPIVVLTRTDDASFALRAVRAGAQDYLLKAELGGDALLRSLRYATERMQAERDRAQLLLAQAARVESDAANRAKDEFIATVSHELRTPLNAILGWARLLRGGQLPPERVPQALATIERNALAQTQLIEDLLDVSRILSGKLRLEFHHMELAGAVHDAVETVRPTADARGVELTLELPDGGESCVLGDPDRAQQIVWNLLSNAVKFTPRGGRVWVRLRASAELVSVEVHDTGTGIPGALLPHVFDRFRQADGATNRAHSGLGLGLAIVRHLVELHGGTVQGESDGPGHGSTFIVRFPRHNRRSSTVPEPPAAGRHEAPPQPPTDSLRGVKVVVVDDEPDARELMSTVLTQFGAEVATAANATEALVALRVLHPAVLVSDIGMPGEDGYSLIRRVRAGDADGASEVPAVALTAYARSEDARKALAAGFQLHASKPIEPAALVALVAKLAGRPTA